MIEESNKYIEKYLEIDYNPVINAPIPNIVDLQMFASPDDEGRTEDPTDYKIRKAREEGRVAKSQELTAGISILGTLGVMFIAGGFIENGIKDIFRETFGRIGDFTMTIESFPEILKYVLFKIIILCAPIFGVAFLVTFIVDLAQVGPMFTTKPLEPKFEKITPKFQRIFFSKTAAFNLLKSILKVGFISLVLYFLINFFTGSLLSLGAVDISIGWQRAGNITLIILGVVSLLLTLLAVIDFFYQKWDYKQNLKMSRYELKEERKDTEGDPFVKQRLRERMRELTNKRMMEQVPKAEVVITNPTHYAVAISYDENTHNAPTVVAKGVDYVALRIKEIAKENDVPIIENRPLARALYDQTEIGDEIPEEFYIAIAEILAYVYRLKNKVPRF